MTRSADRLTLLATFARIAERGSISAAARDLGMSQASASRQLADLEGRLGVQLIQRTTHALSLTEAGNDCLGEARALLDSWESLAERHAGETTDVHGKLKIVAPVALGQRDLAEAAMRFQAAHPSVTITWLLDDAPIRFAEIGCDLWIKVGRVPDDSLVVRQLGSVERLVVAAPKLLKGHRMKQPGDVADLPCAALEPFEGGAIPLESKNGRRQTVRAQVALTTNNIFVAHKAACLGIGYAVMPRWFVADDLAADRLVDVLPRWRAPSLTINAAYLPARRQTKRLRLFVEHVSNAIAAMPGVAAPGSASGVSGKVR